MPLFTSAGTDEGLGEFFKSMQVLLPAFLKLSNILKNNEEWKQKNEIQIDIEVG